MTLTQYLKQKDPIRMPDVIVKKNEYKVSTTHTYIMKEKREFVFFKTKNPLLSGVEYCIINGIFYTVDSDGNPKNRSCFRILIN